MMWPFRLFVPDRDDDSKLHAYFSGTQGRHADIHSTLAGDILRVILVDDVQVGLTVL